MTKLSWLDHQWPHRPSDNLLEILEWWKVASVTGLPQPTMCTSKSGGRLHSRAALKTIPRQRQGDKDMRISLVKYACPHQPFLKQSNNIFDKSTSISSCRNANIATDFQVKWHCPQLRSGDNNPFEYLAVPPLHQTRWRPGPRRSHPLLCSATCASVLVTCLLTAPQQTTQTFGNETFRCRHTSS